MTNDIMNVKNVSTVVSQIVFITAQCAHALQCVCETCFIEFYKMLREIHAP